jgi:NitT/TauT family transport system permease protein
MMRLNLYARKVLQSSILVAVIAIIWHLFVQVLDIPKFLLPDPVVVGATIAANWRLLLSDCGITLLEAAGGFLLGASAAIMLSAAFVYFPALENIIAPYVVALQAVPLVAIAPVLIIWFGNGFASKVIVAALVSFFPIAISATVGLKRVSQETLEVLHLLAATKAQVLLKIRIPTALPFIFSGLRVGSGLSVIGAIVGELAGATRGIGFTIQIATYNTDTPMLFAAIIFACASSVGFYKIVLLVQGFISPAREASSLAHGHYQSADVERI